MKKRYVIVGSQGRRSFFTLLILLAHLCATKATAGGCPAPDPEQSILGCSSVLDDPSVTGHRAAVAYMARADAYIAQRRLDLALKDLTEAVAVEPTLAQAFDERADLHRMRGELALAIEDEAQAIKFSERGILLQSWQHLFAGR
jgi:tetratricopeptide (TPR) repeat protein